MGTVTVGCKVLNGVMIRLSKRGYDDGTGDGERPFVHDGPGIRLNGPSALGAGTGDASGQGLEPGLTDVNAEWMASWLDQHKLDPLVTGGHVFVVDETKGENPIQA